MTDAVAPSSPPRKRRWLWTLHRGVVVLFFLAAWLVVISPPVYGWFLAALVLTELGYWLAPVCALLAVPATGGRLSRISSRGLALIACALFLSPVVRAHWLGPDLRQAAARVAKVSPGEASDVPLAWSRLFRGGTADPVPVETITYREGTPESPALRLDFYAQPGIAHAPCVVSVHGGSWEGGDRSLFPDLNHHLARRGFAVAAVDYRLAPAHPWPAARDDLRDSIRFLRERAEELGIDPERFVLLGRSAGAQIAAVVAYERPDPSIRALISFYGPMDMVFAWKYADPNDILESPRLLRNYLGGGADERPDVYREASPLALVGPGAPPTLIFHGARDELVWPHHSKELARRLTELGRPHWYISLPWGHHAFDFDLRGPGGQISTWAVERFLDRWAPAR